MAILLNADELQALWQQNSAPDLDPDEQLQRCPHHLGQGQRHQIQLRDGISILIHDYQFQDSVIIRGRSQSSVPVEFGFQISGSCLFGDGRVRRAGQCFHCFTTPFPIRLDQPQTLERPGGERILQVDIFLNSPQQLWRTFASQLDWLPPDIRCLFEWIVGISEYPDEPDLTQFFLHLAKRYTCGYGPITPLMRLTLQQLLSCPYQGLSRKLYLEGKVLELIALRLEQLREQLHTLGATADHLTLPSGLQLEDLARIRQAREILSQNLKSPPSLLDLARQVGLNDYKLKVGFRYLFGTTVFGYLQESRLDQALYLLADQGMKVSNVARAVGYSSRTSFVAAFRKKFGASPKIYLQRSTEP